MEGLELVKVDIEGKGIKELIPVYETSEGKKVVDGRELWLNLNVKAQFTDWIKNNLNNSNAIENVDFTSFHSKVKAENTWVNSIEYILTLNIAKEICMIAGAAPRANKETKEISKRYRQYIINVEDKFKEIANTILQNKLLNMDQRLKTLEDKGNRILLCEKRKLQKLKSKRVMELIGGKSSISYKNISFRSKVYASLNKQYNDYFKISSYEYTLNTQLEEAQHLIESFQLNERLNVELQRISGQMKFCLN